MPVALLDGNRQLVLRSPLHFPDHILLVLGQVADAVRPDQLLQGQAAPGLAPHFLLEHLVRDDERQMVAIRPDALVVRPLAGIDALDQSRHFVDRSAHGQAVVGQHRQLRPVVSHLVRHFVRSARKERQLETVPVEDLLDAVVELRSNLLVRHMPFLAPDDLVQVRVDEKPHRGSGPVVQVRGLPHEVLARFLDETQLQGRAGHRVAQLFRRQALQLLVVRERVNEYRPRHIGGVGREPLMMLGVDLLRERWPRDLAGGDIIRDGWDVGCLPEPSHDLLVNRAMPRIDVVNMDRGRVIQFLFLLPELRDRARQQPQHPAHPLEVVERCGLAGERFQNFRMQRVALPKHLHRLRSGRFVGQRVLAGAPLLVVGVYHRFDLPLLDGLEEPPL